MAMIRTMFFLACGFHVTLAFFPTHKMLRNISPARNVFHGEGDYSLGLAPELSGAWTLASYIDEKPLPELFVALEPGGAFTCVSESCSVDRPLNGRWSVDAESGEVEIAVYHTVTKTVRTWYVGTVDPQGALVEGYIGDGAIDTEWVGKFTLRKFMPGLSSSSPGASSSETSSEEDTARAAAAVEAAAARREYGVADLAGPWRVETRQHNDQPEDLLPGQAKKARPAKPLRAADGRRIRRDDVVEAGGLAGSPQVFEVMLNEDLTWHSTAGFGEGMISGRWNVFEDTIQIHSAIKGRGRKLWLECRRLSMQGAPMCKGVSTEDFLYMGKIDVELSMASMGTTAESPQGAQTLAGKPSSSFSSSSSSEGGAASDATPPSVLKISINVKGYIAHGYSNEPYFTGRFVMTRPSTSLAIE